MIYRIFEGYDSATLSNEVNERITKGWQLHGSMKMVYRQQALDIRYAQAMTFDTTDLEVYIMKLEDFKAELKTDLHDQTRESTKEAIKSYVEWIEEINEKIR